jgi:hypothetical protein
MVTKTQTKIQFLYDACLSESVKFFPVLVKRLCITLYAWFTLKQRKFEL